MSGRAAAAVKKKRSRAADERAAATTDAPTTPTPPAAAPPVDEDAAFPRGGAPLRTLGRAPKRVKPGAGDGDDDEPLAFARPPAKNAVADFVPALRACDLTPGVKLLGMVTAVTPRRVDVALPTGLRAAATGDGAAALPPPRGGAAPPLTAVYRVGDYVRCAVLEEDVASTSNRKKKSVTVTMAPSAAAACTPRSGLVAGAPVLAWCVSEEDHGYVMDVGVGGVTGFLPRADAPAGRTLVRGAQVDCIAVAPPSAAGALPLKAAPSTGPGAPTPEPAGGSLAGVTPGTLVNAHIASTTRDGLRLTFWTYFTALVDAFGLPPPAADATAEHTVGAKVRARVVCVDAATKTVRATLVRHVVRREAPPTLPARGALVEAATVVRVDEGLGVLLELGGVGGENGDANADAPTPTTPPRPVYGYAHVSNVTDGRVAKLAKRFAPGTAVPARIVGGRLIDGVASLSLRPADVGRALASAADLVPGATVTGVVDAADEQSGLLVAVAPRVRVRVPIEHLTSGSGPAAVRRRPPGTRVSCLVWSVDPSTGRAVATLRKSLATPKLAPLVGEGAVVPGARTHGVVTGGARGGGIFVSLFGGATGVVPAGATGLPAGADVTTELPRGTLVKPRVVAVGDGGRVTLALTRTGGDDDDAETGRPTASVRQGTVYATAVVTLVDVDADGEVTGVGVAASDGGENATPVSAHLSRAHLADTAPTADTIADAVAVGSSIGPIVILEGGRRGGPPSASRKRALVRAAAALPRDAAPAPTLGAVLPGYVASVTAGAVFVRWLGRATGRVPAPRAGVPPPSDARDPAKVGDTVAATVTAVDAATGRASLSMLPADVGASAAAAALADGFADAALADALRRAADADAAPAGAPAAPAWPAPGDTLRAVPSEVKDYGLLMDVPTHPDALALAPAPRHAGDDAAGAADAARPVSVRVLDVSPSDGVLDVSLRPDLAGRGPRPDGPSAWSVGDVVAATVELVRPTHAILSLPPRGPRGGRALAFAPPPPPAALALGDEVEVTVAARPSDDTGARLIVTLPPALSGGGGRGRDDGSRAAAARAARAAARLPIGAVVDATVTVVHALTADISLPVGGRGALHATECGGPLAAAHPGAPPLAALTPGASIRCVVLGHGAARGARAHGVLDVTCRADAVAAADSAGGVAPAHALARPTAASLRPGDALRGVVAEPTGDGGGALWIALSRTVRGRLAPLDAVACGGDDDELTPLSTRFPPGVALDVVVDRVKPGGRTVDLRLDGVPPRPAGAPAVGEVVTGVVRAVGGAGVRVALRAAAAAPPDAPPSTRPSPILARVALTDVDDTPRSNVLAGIAPGVIVRGRVVAAAKGGRDVGLSLRAADGGALGSAAAASRAPPALDAPFLPPTATPTVGAIVAGYIASVGRAGAFVTLARGADARVRLSDLADGFVSDPASAFPAGTLVTGRVLSVDASGKVGLSLKAAGGGASAAAALAPGAVASGRVRRVEPFGVFIDIDGGGGGRAGLAHVSELADEYVADPAARFEVGAPVRARVLRVDATTGRVSLSLRATALAGAPRPGNGGVAAEAETLDDAVDVDGDIDDAAEEEAGSDDDDAPTGWGGGDDGWPASDSHAGPSDGDDDSASDVSDDDDDASDDDESASMDVDDGGSEGDEGESELSDVDDAVAARPRATAAATLTRRSRSDLDDAPPSPRAARSPAPAAAGLCGLDAGLAVGWGDDDDDGDDNENAPAPLPTSAPSTPAQPTSRAAARRAARAAAAAAAAATDAAEAALAARGAPTDVPSFERALAANPASSLLWIRYVAHLLSLGEPARARAAAERALDAIPLDADADRFNLWVARLNLEALHGAPDPVASTLTLFKEAVRSTDAKKAHLALVSVLDAAGHATAAREASAALTRKFSASCKAWLARHALLLRQGDADGAAACLRAAATAAPPRKHVKLLSRAAVAEFRAGSPDAGRALFERLLAAAPRRLDVWSVYIDQEVKGGDAARVRALLARGTSLDLPPKKARFLFRRALEFEKAMGDDKRADAVRAAARAFVEKVGG